MKNLKKVLAVVLVVCMAFSLMAFTGAANVKDYSDASSIKQTEAVDLFSALGFLQGNNGAFDPTGNITREQAAKIICYMLIGSAKADALKTTISSFSDVAVTRWSAAYIQYCAAAGIINGDGAGKFNPEGNVTGSQFAKMLLVAVGYGKNGEYTGANWEMNVIADATFLGILSLDVDVSAPATREQCAQYGFNAYTDVLTVVYNSTTHAYQQANNIDGLTAKGSLATQQKVNNTTIITVQNGTNYYKWTKDGAELTGNYTSDKVLGTSKDGTSVANLTDSADTKYIASLETVAPGFAVYYNGTVLPQYANGAIVAPVGTMYYNTTTKNVYVTVVLNTANSAADTVVIGRGTIVNLVSTDKDSKAESVQIIKKTAGILSGAPIVNTGNNTVTIAGTNIAISSVATAKVDGYVGLADKDVVLWYLDNTGNYHIEKATAVAGTVNTYVNTQNVTLAGTTYKYSQLGFPGTFANNSVNNWAGLADTTLYLDNGGYVVYGKQATNVNPAANYVFVTDTDTSGFATAAKIVLSDGTKKTVTLDTTSAENGTTTANVNKFYKFAVTADGKYVLTAVALEAGAPVAIGAETANAAAQQNMYNTGAVNAMAITKGSVYFLTDATPLTTTVKANADTRFVLKDDDASGTHYAYSGVANVPNFASNALGEYIAVLYINRVAVFVYAVDTGGAFAPSTTTGDWVYVMSGSYTTNYVSATLTTRTYQVAINGVCDATKTLTVDASKDTVINGTAGLYRVTGYDSNGYATVVTASGGATTPASVHIAALAGDTLDITGGIVTDGTAPNTRALNSSAKIFFVDITAAATTGVTFYEISGAQANALTSTGAVVDYVQTSSTDTSIMYVYVYDTNA